MKRSAPSSAGPPLAGSMEVSDTPWEENGHLLPIFNKPKFVRRGSRTPFEKLYARLHYLEAWLESGEEPEEIEEDDRDLCRQYADKARIRRRAAYVRYLLNTNLLPTPDAMNDELDTKKSQVLNAGLGLFSEKDLIKEGETICYYSGHIHSEDSIRLVGNKDFVLELDDNLLIDPGPLPQIKARYIRDPLVPDKVNCQLVPELNHFRFVVIASRDILKGEELFCSYAETSWLNRSKKEVSNKV